MGMFSEGLGAAREMRQQERQEFETLIGVARAMPDMQHCDLRLRRTEKRVGGQVTYVMRTVWAVHMPAHLRAEREAAVWRVLDVTPGYPVCLLTSYHDCVVSVEQK